MSFVRAGGMPRATLEGSRVGLVAPVPHNNLGYAFRAAMGPAFNRQQRLMAPTNQGTTPCPYSSRSPSEALSDRSLATASIG